MTGPRIDPRISWGNIASLVATVLTAIAMLATLSMWGADMEAAKRAQSLAALGEPAAPDHIAAVVGDDVEGALEYLGLFPVDAV